jgi:Flp pilus assembly secretin CpaC
MPLSAQLTLHIIEADTPTIRRITQAAHRLSDHQMAWEQLQAEVTAGRARLVDVASIETKSGQRARLSAGRFYAYPQTAHTPQPSNPIKFTATIERELVGLTLEIEPVIGGDRHTIDLDVSIKRHAQSPTEHFDISPPQENSIVIDAPSVTFHTQQLTLPTTTANGMRRLLGTWKVITPNGQLNPARTQAIFIQATIIEVNN